MWTGPASGPLRTEPLGEPLSTDLVQRGIATELGDRAAQDAPVDTSGVTLLGGAQGGQVSDGGATEGDVPGPGYAADHSCDLCRYMVLPHIS